MEDEGERARRVQELYREALDLAEQAVLADRQKEYDVAECLYREAANVFNKIIDEDLETEDKIVQIRKKATEYISRANFLQSKHSIPNYNDSFQDTPISSMELPSLYHIVGALAENNINNNTSRPTHNDSQEINVGGSDLKKSTINSNDNINNINKENTNINTNTNISTLSNVNNNNISSFNKTNELNKRDSDSKSMNTLEEKFKYIVEESGMWTIENSGGSISNYSFYKNPQYKLNIHPTIGENGCLKVVLKAKNNLPVNIRLVGGGQRVSTVTKSDITSGAYRHGQCSFEILSIEPGDYTLIVSTFHQKEEGEFLLTLGCSIPFSLSTIPPEGDGMLETVIDGQWIQNVTAMGCVHFNNYFGNPTYRITLSEPTYLLIRLQIQVVKPPGMHIAIFELLDDGSPGKEVASSGAYCNLIQGVVTERILLTPESVYIIIFSTWEPTPGPFTAYIYSNNMIEIQEVCH